MNVVELLRVLVGLDVRLWVEADRLQVDAPAGVLTEALRQALSTCKPDLVRLLLPADSPVDSKQDASSGGLRTPATQMQQADLAGRQRAASGSVGCRVYFEFDVSSLNAERLATSFREVAFRHEALQASFAREGDVRLNEPFRDPPFGCVDLTEAPPSQLDAELASLRARHAHRAFDATRWPLFECVLVHLSQGSRLLLFSVDMLIADAASLRTLFSDWQACYEARSPLPVAVKGAFRAAGLDELVRRVQLDRSVARRYWRQRLADVAAGPSLPLRAPRQGATAACIERVSARLTSQQWQALRARCEALGVAPAIGVTALIADALRIWGGSSGEFVLNFITREPPAALAADSISMGNFASSVLIPVPERRASFAETCRALQREYTLAMQHSQVTGLEAAAELCRDDTFTIAPVAITSLLDSRVHDFAVWPSEPRYAIGQRPQVALDFQISEGANGLCCDCDYDAELFANTQPSQLIDAVQAALTELALAPALAPALARAIDAELPANRSLEAADARDGVSTHAERALERVIVDVWSRVLGQASDVIDAEANFFDLGGDSQQMVQVQYLLVEELGRDVPLLELYLHPQPRLLAAVLGGLDEPDPAHDALALAAAQRAKRRRRSLRTTRKT